MKLKNRLICYYYIAKKHVWCRWFKKTHGRCYPEVWGRGLDGPWHCAECFPCNRGLDMLLDEVR